MDSENKAYSYLISMGIKKPREDVREDSTDFVFVSDKEYIVRDWKYYNSPDTYSDKRLKDNNDLYDTSNWQRAMVADFNGSEYVITLVIPKHLLDEVAILRSVLEMHHVTIPRFEREDMDYYSNQVSRGKLDKFRDMLVELRRLFDILVCKIMSGGVKHVSAVQ